MLPSGYLIRPCEGGGSIIHIVDHMDLEVCTPSFALYVEAMSFPGLIDSNFDLVNLIT